MTKIIKKINNDYKIISEYDSLANQAMGVQSSIRAEANVLIIQPYIKWGPSKSTVAAEIKLQEAQDLIRSLDSWDISESLTVPLLTYSQRTLFGRGKVDELRRLAKKYNGNAEKKVNFQFCLKKNVFEKNCFFSLDQLYFRQCQYFNTNAKKSFGGLISIASAGSIFRCHTNSTCTCN